MESAKEKFNRVLELRPDFAAALFCLGEIAFDRADYERAAALFNHALQTDNTLRGPHYRLAQRALMQGRRHAAREHLLSEVNLGPEDSDLLVSVASMFFKIDDHDSATDCLLRAISIDCANADAYYYLGLASAVNGRLEEAVEYFGHTADIRPDDIRALRDAAVVYLAMGNVADAADRIQKARSLATNDLLLKSLESRVKLVRRKKRVADFLSRLGPRFISKLKSYFRGPPSPD